MLDKSLPYYNIIMRRPHQLPLPTMQAPFDCLFRTFLKGDEPSWSHVVTSVGEFATLQDATAYFQQNYQPHLPLEADRIFFALSADGRIVGTAMSWWNSSFGQNTLSLHWLAVCPLAQKRGVGAYLLGLCLNKFAHIAKDQDVYVHTQTWSHTAIGLYLKYGFELMEEGSFGGYQNDYQKALPLLRALKIVPMDNSPRSFTERLEKFKK